MQALLIKPGVQDLINAWLSAKETEKTWSEYRLQVENALLAHYEQEIGEIKAGLAQATQLTETVKVGELKIALGRTLKIEQTQAALFCSAHPELINIVLRYEYKAANSSSLLGAMFAEGKLGEEVSKIVEIKDSKPSFSKA